MEYLLVYPNMRSNIHANVSNLPFISIFGYIYDARVVYIQIYVTCSYCTKVMLRKKIEFAKHSPFQNLRISYSFRLVEVGSVKYPLTSLSLIYEY